MTFKGKRTGRRYKFIRDGEPVQVDWLDADCFLEWKTGSGKPYFEKVSQSANRSI